MTLNRYTKCEEEVKYRIWWLNRWPDVGTTCWRDCFKVRLQCLPMWLWPYVRGRKEWNSIQTCNLWYWWLTITWCITQRLIRRHIFAQDWRFVVIWNEHSHKNSITGHEKNWINENSVSSIEGQILIKKYKPDNYYRPMCTKCSE